jgi:hypothetical protein
MEIDLEYEGLFVLAASSGYKDPDHHLVKSFKAWNT